SANDGGIRADGASPLEYCRFVQRVPVHLRTRIADVGKNAGGAEEYVVFNDRAGVDGDVVLNFDVVADYRSAVNVDVLSDDALFSDARAFHDVSKVPDLAARADFRAIVGECGVVHEVGQFFFLAGRVRVQCDRAFDQGPLAGIENAQDSQAFLAIADRRLARRDAINKVLALGPQGLACFQRNDFRFCFYGGGNAIFPFDLVRIQDQFVLRGIVEHGHLFGTDHDQPLLLNRMQPADENVGTNATGKIEGTHGDVRNVLVQVRAAVAGYLAGHFVEQRQHYGNIVRREAPQDIFFGADFSNVQAVGVDVVNFSQRAVFDQLLKLEDCGVVAQNVADHQDAAFGLGQTDKLFSMLHVDGERLFHQHVFSGFERGLGHLIVGNGGRGEGDGGDGGIGEDVGEFAVELQAGIFRAESSLNRFLVIAKRGQRAQFIEVSHQVLSPVPDSRNRNFHF